MKLIRALICMLLLWSGVVSATVPGYIFTPVVDYAASCNGGTPYGQGLPAFGIIQSSQTAYAFEILTQVYCDGAVDAGWYGDYNWTDSSAIVAYFGSGVPGTSLDQKQAGRANVTFDRRVPCAEHAGEEHLSFNKGFFWETTIAALDGGVVTPATFPPATMNVGGCIVERNYAVELSAYIAQGATATVGMVLYVGLGFTVTPTSSSTTTEGLTDYPENLGDEVGGEGGGDSECDRSTGAACTPVADDTYCIDEDGDGIDDETEESCAIISERALKEMNEAMIAQFAAVGSGATLGGDVVTLAGQNGGMFSMPSQIFGTTSFLNPLTDGNSCKFDLVIPAAVSVGFAGFTMETGWCSVKTATEPFFAFAMWVLTCFVGYTQFQRGVKA